MRVRQKKVFPILIVVLTGLSFGGMIWKTWYNPPPYFSHYGVDEGYWIGAQDGSSVIFLRKKMYLHARITSAWIKIGSLGGHTLFVNGKKIAENRESFDYSYGVYDLSGVLREGTNVVAIRASQNRPTGYTKIVVEGEFTEISGDRHTFISDDSWLFSSTELFQKYGSRPWYDLKYDDLSWSSATVLGRVGGRPFSASIIPELITSPPQGIWLYGNQVSTGNLIFSSSFSLKSYPDGAWLRIGSDDKYSLQLNGTTLVENVRSATSYDIYDVTKFLSGGTNQLSVIVTSNSVQQPKILLDGLSVESDEVEVFVRTNEDWDIQNPGKPWEKVTEFTPYEMEPVQLLKNISQTTQKNISIIKQMISAVTIVSIVITLFLMASICIAKLVERKKRTGSLWEHYEVDALLHLPSLLGLSAFYILCSAGTLAPLHSLNVSISIGLIALLIMFKIFFLSQVYLGRDVTVSGVQK